MNQTMIDKEPKVDPLLSTGQKKKLLQAVTCRFDEISQAIAFRGFEPIPSGPGGQTRMEVCFDV